MCPAPERLAAAASGEDADATRHAMSCAACAGIVDEQRELIAIARSTKVKPLSGNQRDELAAEIMAAAEVERRAPRAGRWLIAVGGVAAAALAALLLVRDEPATTIAVLPAASTHEIEPRSSITMAESPPPARRAPEIVKLTNGELSIDASERDPVTVVAGDTSVIVRARAKITARGGVIVTAHVFAGTAEIERAGRREIVVAGDVWEREPPVHVDALAAFRAGWEALRAGRHGDSVAAFDQATDEVVVEDAMFWAAIASERAGDREEAGRRLRAFLERFPGSPRADAARSALERVTR